MPLYAIAYKLIDTQSGLYTRHEIDLVTAGDSEKAYQVLRERPRGYIPRTTVSYDMAFLACKEVSADALCPPTQLGVSASVFAGSITVFSEHAEERDFLTTDDGLRTVNEFIAGLRLAEAAWRRLPVSGAATAPHHEPDGSGYEPI